MRTRTFMSVLGALALTMSVTGAWGAETQLSQISGGGFTVSYPAGTETQAKHVLELATQAIGPSLDVNKQIISFLSNSESMSKDIATLLGCPEKQDKAKTYLLAFKDRSDALVRCFSNIRLIKKAEAVATGEVDAGILQVRYDKIKDEFNMMINLENITPDDLKASYFPIFLNADGSIRAEKSIGDMAVDFMGSSKTMVIAPVHETVASLMAKDLSLYQPFARWFSEGVSGWVARHVIAKTDPKLAKMSNDLLSVSANSANYRAKINFLAWPQRAFQNQRDPDADPAFEVAQTQYAIQLVSDIVGKDGAQTLPKIMRELDFNPNADTEAIVTAIKKTTGKDVRPTLMTYVPKSVRDGIAAGEPKKLLTRAEALAGEKKWGDASAKLKLALQMTPEDVNARLNYAWIEREQGMRLDSEIQIFLAARLLKPGAHSFHMYGDSLEGNYILGRFAILMGNLEYAKKFLQPVLAAKPDHPDAKRAMEEVRTLEAAAGVPTPAATR